jgi:putative ABC transport system substrate-binding protein
LQGKVENGKSLLKEVITKSPKLIVAIGTEALQSIINENISNIPIVFTMVLNPEAIIPKGMKNITGVSWNVPPEPQLKMIREAFPNVKRVGVIYNPSATQKFIKDSAVYASTLNIELVVGEVFSEGQIAGKLKEIEGKIDALWMVADATVISFESFKYMLDFSYRNGIPFIGLSAKHVKSGAIFSLSPDYVDAGKKAGEVTNSILTGRSPEEIRYLYADKFNLTLNLSTAERLNLIIPKNVVSNAVEVYK